VALFPEDGQPAQGDGPAGSVETGTIGACDSETGVQVVPGGFGEVACADVFDVVGGVDGGSLYPLNSKSTTCSPAGRGAS
jgi:hypothetical protein